MIYFPTPIWSYCRSIRFVGDVSSCLVACRRRRSRRGPFLNNRYLRGKNGWHWQPRAQFTRPLKSPIFSKARTIYIFRDAHTKTDFSVTTTHTTVCPKKKTTPPAPLQPRFTPLHIASMLLCCCEGPKGLHHAHRQDKLGSHKKCAPNADSNSDSDFLAPAYSNIRILNHLISQMALV